MKISVKRYYHDVHIIAVLTHKPPDIIVADASVHGLSSSWLIICQSCVTRLFLCMGVCRLQYKRQHKSMDAYR